MEYRREIDGLRAIAVVPVILFHAGFQSFSGGFVGVDVFFVISGYLITSIILTEKENNTFTIVNFYERRARRILPALFIVVFTCIPFAWLWLLPTDFKDFSQSIIAVVTFSSNILFWKESGYWGTENELKPLLHTWSLAVEEQYYLIFPLFLAFFWRFKRNWLLYSFIIIAILSLSFAQWLIQHSPSAAFFLLPARAWELSIGACIAYFSFYHKTTLSEVLKRKVLSEGLSLFGFLLIAYSVFKFNEATPFPGFYAMIPTFGTALIILFSTPNNYIGRLLSLKPVVGIGLISYSAYLWHQPFFAFARHRSLHEPAPIIFIILATISTLVAYISWRYIEKPFRSKGIYDRKAIFIISIIVSVLFLAFGLTGHFTNGFNFRTAEDGTKLWKIESKLLPNYGLSRVCDKTFTLSEKCRTSEEPEVLLWGDSFAMHLLQGIVESKPDVSIIQMTKSVCGPIFDLAPVRKSTYTKSWAAGCLQFNQDVRKWLQKNDSVKYAVISLNFYNYITKERNLLLRDGTLIKANKNIVAKELADTLSELQSLGIRTIVFSHMPSNGEDIGRCLAKTSLLGKSLDICNINMLEIPEDRREVNQFFNSLEKDIPVFYLNRSICSDNKCQTHIDSTFLYRDKYHLSTEGSSTMGLRADFYKVITSGK